MNNIYDNENFFDEYAKMYRSQKGLEGAGEWWQLQKMFPNLSGKKMLDLGCGYGWHCKFAEACGAQSVLGVDLSEKMIEAAKSKNSGEKITYKVCSLDDFDYPEHEFDFVVCNLVLHYIEDLNQIYRRINRTLKAGGIFVFNIEHPVFTGSISEDWIYDDEGKPLYWPVDNYFYPGLRQTNFLGCNVEKYHHTLTQIINGLLENGFSIEKLEEAMPPENMLALAGMKEEMRRPMMLMVRAAKK